MSIELPSTTKKKRTQHDELPSDPKLRKQMINRLAQQAFRARREDRIKQLEMQLQERQENETKLLQQINNLNQEIQHLKEENYLLKQAKFPESTFHDSSCQASASCSDENLITMEQEYPKLELFDQVSIQQDYSTSDCIEDKRLLKCAPENETPCKKKILNLLSSLKGKSRKLCQINDDIRSYCPEVSIDKLHQALNAKVSTNSNHIMTDSDIDAYIDYIKNLP